MLKRLNKQISDFADNPSPNFHLLNYTFREGYAWVQVRMIGPQNSLYQFTQFNLQVRVPSDYPFKPPKINFITKIYHPNVYYSSGAICCCTIPQLKDQWSPALTIPKLLSMIVKMMEKPFETLSECGDQDTIQLFKKNYNQFKKKAIHTAQVQGEKGEFD